MWYSCNKARGVFPIVNNFWFPGKFYVEVHNVKFNVRPSSGNGFDACGKTGGQSDGQTDRHRGRQTEVRTDTAKAIGVCHDCEHI